MQRMTLGEVMPKYQAYSKKLFDEKKTIKAQLDEAKKNFEITGQEKFGKEAVELEISLKEKDDEYKANQDILSQLSEQYTAAWNAEVAKAESDPETGMAAEMGRIFTTAMRMSRGDNVPYTDEKKLQEFSEDMYMAAKQAQAMMKQMENNKSKDHDSLWEDVEGGDYDPKEAADNTMAAGELPDVPSEEGTVTEGTDTI